jgi:hypothetical protein
LALADVMVDGPPVRVRDLIAITGLSKHTVYRDIDAGHLHAFRRNTEHRVTYFVDRDVARLWLLRLGFSQRRDVVIPKVVPLMARRHAM